MILNNNKIMNVLKPMLAVASLCIFACGVHAQVGPSVDFTMSGVLTTVDSDLNSVLESGDSVVMTFSIFQSDQEEGYALRARDLQLVVDGSYTIVSSTLFASPTFYDGSSDSVDFFGMEKNNMIASDVNSYEFAQIYFDFGFDEVFPNLETSVTDLSHLVLIDGVGGFQQDDSALSFHDGFGGYKYADIQINMISASAVPEPSTYALMIGFVALACSVLRRRLLNARS